MEQILCGSVRDRSPSFTTRYPWLISESLEDENQDKYLYTIHNELPQYQCRIPELIGKLIHGCFHGWVVLSNYQQNNKWSLWNQVTSKIITLPTLILEDGNYESIGQCCLSAPPDDPSSILLLSRTNKSTFVFCRLGSKRKKFRWTEMSYAKQLKRLSFNGKLLHNLTCCNDKVYALSTDGCFANLVIQVDIMVRRKEVVITLMLLCACPPSFHASYRCRGGDINFYLKGSCVELFYMIYFENNSLKTPTGVYLFILDMTSKKWEELQGLKDWDISDLNFDDWRNHDHTDFNTSRQMWKEIDDLKGANLFLDRSRDQLVSYSRVITSKLGGYIHIRCKMGKTIYSYHVKDKTISLYSMSSQICRLEDDHSNVEMENNSAILLRPDTNDRVEFKESHLLDIFFHLLETIMENCVGVEYMKFRAACRQCLLAAPVIKWSNKTSLQRLRTYSVASPWLMVLEGKNQDVITFKDPMLGDNYLMKKLPVSIVQDKIFSSKFGWLLLRRNDLWYLALYNPFTNDLRKLPQSEYSLELESLNFSAPPTSANCIVVGFTTMQVWHVHIHFVNREPTWHIFYLGPDPQSIYFSSFYDEDLYALSEKGEVIVFNYLGQQRGYSWKIVEAEAPESVCGSLTQKFLTKYEQHLLLIYVSEYGKHVQVFMLNVVEQKWEKIIGIGKHMIYICDTTCVCLEAKTLQMENKIFFPRVHSKNRMIVFYSLDTCMYHTFDDKNIQQADLFGTTSYITSHAWIEPSWS